MHQFDLDNLRSRLRARPPRRVAIVPPLREAAVALVLAPDADADVLLLFIRRAEHPADPWSGQIALPGGRRDQDDRDLLATAARETEEETGIRLTAADLLGELDDLSPVSPHLPPIVVRPFVFAVPQRPAIRRSAEVADHFWVPRKNLLTGSSEAAVTVRGRTLVVPGYRAGPHFIWGMTERIITPFISLTRQ